MIRQVGESGGSPEVYADFDAVGDGDRGDFFDLPGSAFEVDVSLVDGHFPVIPGLGTLTARSSSAADAKMLVRDADGAGDLDALGLSIAYKLVGDLLHGIESAAAESDAGAFDFLILNTLLLLLISHLYQ